MPLLLVKQNNKIIKEIVIAKPRTIIGRGAGSDLEIHDNLASRQHCEIIKINTQYKLTDLHSSNGTMVNRQKITTAYLKDNDEIQIGSFSITFKNPSAFAGASTFVSRKDDIVKSIKELPAEYRLDMQEFQNSGQSLIAAPVTAGLVDNKSSKKFFILYQLGKAVSSAKTLNEIMDIAMYSIFDCINADRGTIMLIDKENENLKSSLSRIRTQKEPVPDIAVSSTIVSKVLTDKVAIVIGDAMADDRFSMGMSVAKQNIRSALCVPLWEKQDVLGVIYADNLVKPRCFSVDDIDLLSAIANQIAIRIKQDELYRKLNQEAIMRANLERYHSPDIVEFIVAKGGVDFPAEEKEITVLFADIQNFTSLSEKMQPSEIADMLNDFFELTTNIIFEYQGSVNKYIGDATMAIFGAPVSSEDHAINAAQCAIKMIQTLKNESFAGKTPYHIRIGINTGVVVAGNIGSKKRIEYTVLGDTVNIASRLNQFGESNQIVIGESTFNQIKTSGIKAKDLGHLQLKGKEKDVRAYRIIL